MPQSAEGRKLAVVDGVMMGPSRWVVAGNVDTETFADVGYWTQACADTAATLGVDANVFFGSTDFATAVKVEMGCVTDHYRPLPTLGDSVCEMLTTFVGRTCNDVPSDVRCRSDLRTFQWSDIDSSAIWVSPKQYPQRSYADSFGIGGSFAYDSLDANKQWLQHRNTKGFIQNDTRRFLSFWGSERKMANIDGQYHTGGCCSDSYDVYQTVENTWIPLAFTLSIKTDVAACTSQRFAGPLAFADEYFNTTTTTYASTTSTDASDNGFAEVTEGVESTTAPLVPTTKAGPPVLLDAFNGISTHHECATQCESEVACYSFAYSDRVESNDAVVQDNCYIYSKGNGNVPIIEDGFDFYMESAQCTGTRAPLVSDANTDAPQCNRGGDAEASTTTALATAATTTNATVPPTTTELSTSVSTSTTTSTSTLAPTTTTLDTYAVVKGSRNSSTITLKMETTLQSLDELTADGVQQLENAVVDAVVTWSESHALNNASYFITEPITADDVDSVSFVFGNRRRGRRQIQVQPEGAELESTHSLEANVNLKESVPLETAIGVADGIVASVGSSSLSDIEVESFGITILGVEEVEAPSQPSTTPAPFQSALECVAPSPRQGFVGFESKSACEREVVFINALLSGCPGDSTGQLECRQSLTARGESVLAWNPNSGGSCATIAAVFHAIGVDFNLLANPGSEKLQCQSFGMQGDFLMFQQNCGIVAELLSTFITAHANEPSFFDNRCRLPPFDSDIKCSSFSVGGRRVQVLTAPNDPEACETHAKHLNKAIATCTGSIPGASSGISKVTCEQERLVIEDNCDATAAALGASIGSYNGSPDQPVPLECAFGRYIFAPSSCSSTEFSLNNMMRLIAADEHSSACNGTTTTTTTTTTIETTTTTTTVAATTTSTITTEAPTIVVPPTTTADDVADQTTRESTVPTVTTTTTTPFASQIMCAERHGFEVLASSDDATINLLSTMLSECSAGTDGGIITPFAHKASQLLSFSADGGSDRTSGCNAFSDAIVNAVHEVGTLLSGNTNGPSDAATDSICVLDRFFAIKSSCDAASSRLNLALELYSNGDFVGCKVTTTTTTTGTTTTTTTGTRTSQTSTTTRTATATTSTGTTSTKTTTTTSTTTNTCANGGPSQAAIARFSSPVPWTQGNVPNGITWLVATSLDDCAAKCREDRPSCSQFVHSSGRSLCIFFPDGVTIDPTGIGAQRFDFEVYSLAAMHNGVCTDDEFTTYVDTCHKTCTQYSACSNTEYESAGPTPTSNRECTACSSITNCTANEYIASQCEPGGTTDFVCAPYSTCDNSTMFESAGPTPTSDRRCTTATVCGANQFELVAKSSTRDRFCVNATACTAGIEYEYSPLTPAANRVCAQISVCDGSSKFEAAASTPTTDRQCEVLAVCDRLQEFEARPPNATADRHCQKLAVCETPFVEAVAPTSSTDRECKESADWSEASGLCVGRAEDHGLLTRSACMDKCASRFYCTGITWGSHQEMGATGRCYTNGAACCRSETLVPNGLLPNWETWLHTPRCSAQNALFSSASLGCAPSTSTSSAFSSRGGVDISASVPANNLAARADLQFDADHSYAAIPEPKTNGFTCIGSLLGSSGNPFASLIGGKPVAVPLATAEAQAAAGPHLCFALCDTIAECVVTQYDDSNPNVAECLLYNTCTTLLPSPGAPQLYRRPDRNTCDQASCPTSRECETVSCSAGKCLVERHPAGAVCSDGVDETLGDSCSDSGACVSGPCKDGQFALAFETTDDDRSTQKLCVDQLECCANEFEATAGSADADRSCIACNQCKPWEYETQACDAVGGRQCAALQPQCGANEYEACNPTSSSDRVCMPHTVCLANSTESATPTSKSDRVCRGEALPDLQNFVAPVPWPIEANADSTARMSWTSHAAAEECAIDCLESLPACHAFAFSDVLSACVYFLGGGLPVAGSGGGAGGDPNTDQQQQHQNPSSGPFRADFQYYSRAPHATLDSATDLLSPGVHRQDGIAATPATDGVYCVGDDGSGDGLLVAAAPAAGSAFRISMAVAIQSGSKGYLFSRSDGRDGSRYFSLYVQSNHRGLVFYYRVAGSSTQHSARFPGVDVADGSVHHVELWVSFTDVTVVLDGVSYNKNLEAAVDDCGSSGTSTLMSAAPCVTHVGQRAGGYVLQGGCFSKATLDSWQPVRGIPSVPAHVAVGTTCVGSDSGGGGGSSTPTALTPTGRVVNLLSTAVHKQALAAVDASQGAGFCIGGDANGGGNAGGLLIAAAPATGSVFRVAIVATIPTRSFGYLFARSDSSGSRYFGLYVQPRHAGVVFYYRTAKSPPSLSSAQASARFPTSMTGVRLADGEAHSVEVWVTLSAVTLVVDGKSVGMATLDAPVQDCGAADRANCITHLGQREGGYPILGGCIASALFQPSPHFDLLGTQATQCFVKAAAAAGSRGRGGIALPNFPIGRVGRAFSVELEVQLGHGSGSSGGGGGSGGNRSSSSSSNDAIEDSGELLLLGGGNSTAGRDPLDAAAPPVVRGYLFSKGDGADGRYYSLYVMAEGQGTPVFYYKTLPGDGAAGAGGGGVQRKVEFTAAAGIADDNVHTLTLSVDASYPAKVMLLVDGTTRHVEILDGAVDDCDGPGPACTLHLGKRNGGHDLSAGCISRAIVHPNNVV